MQWWSRYQQKRAAKRFGGRLQTALRRRYGARDHFTEPQIRRTVEDMRMPSRHMNLWLAGFMAEDEVEQEVAKRPEWREVMALRQEVWRAPVYNAASKPSGGAPLGGVLAGALTVGGSNGSVGGDAGGGC